MKTRTFKKIAGGAIGVLAAASLAASAHAAVTIVYGAGSSGVTSVLAGTDGGGGMPFLNDGDGTISWGIPGVSAGETPSTFNDPVTSILITFVGAGSIDFPSIAVGNSAGCEGGSGGGTTFCAGASDTPWTVTTVTASSILFTATAGNDLMPDEDFFVNVFFDGNGPSFFTVAATSVPEPATWALLLAGFGLTGYALRRRYRLATTA